MRVLLTGAFGNIGQHTLRELLAAGHRVRCFDVDTPANRARAARLGDRVEVHWGDVRRRDAVRRALAGREVVIHDAAILPPASERDAAMTRAVNVEGTRTLVECCEARSPSPRLVFASSISVFGLTQDRPPPRRADDPLAPCDVYSASKAEAEALVRGSRLDWLILRFAGAPSVGFDLRRAAESWSALRLAPHNRIEFLHPADAGLAQARAVDAPDLRERVLLVGGGPRCQVRMRDLVAVFTESLGLGRLPDAAFGDEPFYTDWIDTDEGQARLRYQRHDLADFQREIARSVRALRPFLVPCGPLVRRLAGGPVWRALRAAP
jgi:nucleoside-diphosphate-sugar epimerase